MTFEHVFADLGGIPANRLADTQGLAGLLLAAANAAGLNPAHPPVVTLGPLGVAAALVCHGGHVTLHGVPEAGLCFRGRRATAARPRRHHQAARGARDPD